MTRNLTGTIKIHGIDHEYLGPNEEIEVEYIYGTPPWHIHLEVGQPPVPINIPDVRWGDECRVEIRVKASAFNMGEIKIEGTVSLFEGDDEDTTDLDDRKDISFIVPRYTSKNPQIGHYEVKLSNEGFGGGDKAVITFNLTNSILELE